MIYLIALSIFKINCSMKNSLKGKIFTLLTNNYEEISYAHMKYIKLQLSVKCILIFLVSGIYKKKQQH